MPRIPRDESPDATLALLRDPYGFISKRCRRYRSDLFETRLLLRKTICMTGPRAAELFYDPDRFARSGASPRRFRKTLFGEGGVQGLDDEAHRRRKQMLMSLMTPERIGRLAETTAGGWESLRLHPPGRRGPPREPPLRGRVDHDPANEGRLGLPRLPYPIRRARAGLADRLFESARPTTKPLRHPQRQGARMIPRGVRGSVRRTWDARVDLRAGQRLVGGGFRVSVRKGEGQ